MRTHYTFATLLVAAASEAKFEMNDGAFGGLSNDGSVSNDFSLGNTDFSIDDPINFGISSEEDSSADINKIVGLINPDEDFWGAFYERRLAIQSQQDGQDGVSGHDGNPDHILDNEIDVRLEDEEIDLTSEVTHPIDTQLGKFFVASSDFS